MKQRNWSCGLEFNRVEGDNVTVLCQGEGDEVDHLVRVQSYCVERNVLYEGSKEEILRMRRQTTVHSGVTDNGLRRKTNHHDW